MAEHPVLSEILPALLQALESSGSFARHLPERPDQLRQMNHELEELRAHFSETLVCWDGQKSEPEVFKTLQACTTEIEKLDAVNEKMAKQIIIRWAEWTLQPCTW